MSEYDPLPLNEYTDPRGIVWSEFPTTGKWASFKPSWAIRFGFPADPVGRYTGPSVSIRLQDDGRWYFTTWADEEGYATRDEAMMSERTLEEIRRVFRSMEAKRDEAQAKLDRTVRAIPTGLLVRHEEAT